jgi:hypothetical protein
MTLRISLAQTGALLAGTVTLLAQPWTGGTGYGGGAATGLGGGYGGPTLARVNVAPLAGGGLAAGMGASGFGAPAAGAGGLFGVTRPTFMGEANAIAGQFFSNAGVPLTGVTAGTAATTVSPPGYAHRARAGPASPARWTQHPAASRAVQSGAPGAAASLAAAGTSPRPPAAAASTPGVSRGRAFPMASAPSGTRLGRTVWDHSARATGESMRSNERLVR